MDEIKSGILAGVKVDEEKAEVLASVAEKIKEMDNGKVDAEELTLGDMMGAGSKVSEEKGEEMIVPEGTPVAAHGVLTGAEIPEGGAKVLGEVAKTLEEVEAFEADGTKKSAGIEEISDTLAVAMGVKPNE